MISARTLPLVVLLLVAVPAAAQQKRRPRRPVPTKPAAASASNAVTMPSGLTYVITHRANGRRPKPGETVLVHYTGMLTNGKTFDSSQERNEPIAFPLGKGRVIKGWDEGIALLGVGDTAVLVIPPELGYGAREMGNGVIPANSTLVFVVQLVDIKSSSVSDLLLKTIEERGVDAAVAEYRALRTNGFGDVYNSEGELNGVGYALLGKKRVKEAIAIFNLNVEAYPTSANAYDSLGEAYAVDGATAQAIGAYQKSLELDPRNENAVRMLEKLKAP
jgi:peptidylprolyl isomerase